MSQFPNDDHELINFLKQHRPQTPPSSPMAEDRLLEAIAAVSPTNTETNTVVAFRRSHRVQRSSIWLVPPAIAAGLVATIVGYRAFVPAKPSAAELANLQAFIESNWQGSVTNGNTDEDTSLFNDGTTN